MIDYWCNAFTPDRASAWRAVIEQEELEIRTRAGDADDDFADPGTMVARMDRLGVATLVLPVCDLPARAELDDFAVYAVRPAEIEQLAAGYPGRFVGVFSVNPTLAQHDRAAAQHALATSWCVGLHTHTHSWARPFDHPDYLPYYQLCADADVPFVMQAGASGGNFDHQCGHPATISQPARRFPSVSFVLSHTGAPWVTETIEKATRHDNVFVGSATHPPRRWPPELIDFIRGPGRERTLFGTGFPVTGHTRSLAQLEAIDFDDVVRADLLDGNARRIFGRIPSPGG